jgi:hypothetical protein
VIDFDEIVLALNDELPEIARQTIRRHLDLSNPDNQTFLARPDGRDQHQTHWHRWGILTHTRVFLELYETVVPERLSEWGMWDDVEEALSKPVDGLPRLDLLKVSILLHDIGKFAARTRGGPSFHFSGHERLSGAIIREEIGLERHGLTQAQIDYVAMTAEDHFVLGLVRKRARELGEFTLDFPRTPEFRELSRKIKANHPEDFIEIGVLFLGDSLAKIDPQRGPERALGQSPINESVAQGYLQIVLQEPSI